MGSDCRRLGVNAGIAQPVQEHAGDERPLFVDRGLFLDDRGQGDDLGSSDQCMVLSQGFGARGVFAGEPVERLSNSAFMRDDHLARIAVERELVGRGKQVPFRRIAGISSSASSAAIDRRVEKCAAPSRSWRSAGACAMSNRVNPSGTTILACSWARRPLHAPHERAGREIVARAGAGPAEGRAVAPVARKYQAKSVGASRAPRRRDARQPRRR